MIMPLILNREEAEPLLDLLKAIELTEEAYRQQAEGRATARAPYHIHVGGDGAIRVLSGALLDTGAAIVRLGPSYGLGGNQDARAAGRYGNGEVTFPDELPFWHAENGSDGRSRGAVYGEGRHRKRRPLRDRKKCFGPAPGR